MSFIIKQPERNCKVSIHLATSIYTPGKKHPGHLRQYIGVLDSNSNELILGRNQPEPDSNLLELLRRKGIIYNGRRRNTSRDKSRDKRSCNIFDKTTVLELGRFAALKQLSVDSGLLPALESGFGKELASRLLSLAIHQACQGEGFYLAEAWLEETIAGNLSGISASSLCRLATTIGVDRNGQQDFFRKWIKACGSPKSLIHDTTSISSYAEDLELAEWGYNRDNENLPQINLALVMTAEKNLPLWYRTIPGSIPDVSSLGLTAKLLMELGLREFSYTLDRGYFSNANLSGMLNLKMDFTIGVPLNTAQAKAIIDKHYKKIENIRHAFLYNGKIMRHISCSYDVTMKDDEVRTLPAHLYFDPERKRTLLNKLEVLVLQLEDKADKLEFTSINVAEEWLNENAKKIKAFLKIDAQNNKFRIIRNAEAINKASKTFGMTLIVTTKINSEKKSLLNEYRSRDMAEKIFDTYKNSTNNDRLRSGDNDAVQGRIFIAFLSVILHSLFESKLKNSMLLKNYSVQEALALLRKIKILKLESGKTILLDVPKKARDAASVFGLQPDFFVKDGGKFL